MKKVLTLFFLLAVSLLVSQAQTTGSDSYGYVWRNSNDASGPVYSWVDIASRGDATLVNGLGDDNTVGPFNCSFNFHYYWYDIPKFWIGSNGYIIFVNGQLSSAFPAIPATSAPNDFIAPFMSDLNFDGPTNYGRCYYWMSADSMIIEWDSVPFWQPAPPAPLAYTGANTFEIILCKADSSILFQYKLQSGITQTTTGGFISAGIENNSGAIGDQNFFNPAAPYVPSSFAVKYAYPSGTVFSVNDASSVYCNNTDNGALFINKGGHPFSMNGYIKNVGNQPLSAFTVNVKVTGPIPGAAIRAQDNFTSSALSPSQGQAVNFTNTFNPTSAAGTYNYFTITQSPGDVFPGNDSAKVELHVVDSTAHTILLSYDDGTHDAGATGLSWQGGNGGAGIYIIPPYYPCEINNLRYFIVGDTLGVGYTAKIFDDSGPGGLPGAELFTYAQSAVTTSLSWDTIDVEPPVTINSGGFYVAWLMNGNSIALGQDQSMPVSNRTFEVLGSTWAIYRARETEDLMINAIMKGNFGAGIEDATHSMFSSRVWPVPAVNKLNVAFTQNTGKNDGQISIYDIRGAKIESESFSSSQVNGNIISVNVSGLPNGIYFSEIRTAAGISRNKFTVMH